MQQKLLYTGGAIKSGGVAVMERVKRFRPLTLRPIYFRKQNLVFNGHASFVHTFFIARINLKRMGQFSVINSY